MSQTGWNAGKPFRCCFTETLARLQIFGGAGYADTDVGKGKQDFVDIQGSVNFSFHYLNVGDFLEITVHSLKGGS